MNQAIIMGRIVREPDVKQTPTGLSVASFTLAVDRKYKNSEGVKETDFINIVAWRQLAEFVGKYCTKGIKLLITGTIQIRSYENKEGRKVYLTEIIASDIEFAESKNTNQNISRETQAGVVSIAEDDNTELPFDL